MTKTVIKGMVVSALILSAASLSAGSLDYLSNQNADYFLSASQNASTADAGIVPYNPAGTALMEKGLYLDVSNQTIFKMYSESEDAVLKEDYELNAPTWVLPNLSLVYNFGAMGPGKLSVYGQGGVVAGGGSLDWTDGTIGTDGYVASSIGSIALMATGGLMAKSVPAAAAATTVTGYATELEASSVYYGMGGGVAYSLLEDMVSASAGVRYNIAKRTGKISGTMNFTTPALGGAWKLDIVDDYEYEAAGFTPIFGLDIRPISNLTIGVRYEMETDLEFTYSTNEISATSSNAAMAALAAGVKTLLPDYDDVEANQNLPQVLSLGAEYRFSPQLTASAGSTVYLIGDADMNEFEDNFGIGYEINAAVGYRPVEKLLVGGTFMYTDQGTESDYFEKADVLTVSANPALDSIMFGLGVQYELFANFDALLSGSFTKYLSESATTASALEVTYDKQTVNVGLGLKYKL